MANNKSNWLDLEKPLNKGILDVIQKFGFKTMTPIQVKSSKH